MIILDTDDNSTDYLCFPCTLMFWTRVLTSLAENGEIDLGAQTPG